MRGRGMGMEYSRRGMGITLRDIGSMIREKDKAVTIIMIRISYSLVSGSQINPRPVSTLRSRMTMVLRISTQRNPTSLTHTYYHQ